MMPHSIAKVGQLLFSCRQTLPMDGASVAWAGVAGLISEFSILTTWRANR